MPFAPGCFWSPYSRPTFLSISFGPPLAKCHKMADLGVLAKFVLTRLCGHLWSRSLQQNVVLCLHFKCILIRRWCHLRQGVFEAPIVGLLFWAFCLGPPLAKCQKMADLGPCQICHNSALRTLMEPQFAAKCCAMFALQVHTNWEMIPFAPGCFWSPYSRPTLLSILAWSPLGKISENGRFRCPCQICHNSALRTLMEPQFAEKCFAMFALQVHTN